MGVQVRVFSSRTLDVREARKLTALCDACSNWLAFAAQRRMLDFFMVDETTALFLQGLVKWGSLAIAISVIIRAMGYKTAGIVMRSLFRIRVDKS
eukprot:745079-Rhodomonas_salina.1